MGSSCKIVALVTPCTVTSILSMEWNKNYWLSHWKPKQTFGVCLSHLNTELKNVFLLYGGNIKQSAITSGQYQNLHSIKEFYFIAWNTIMGHWSGHSGCGGHCGGKEGIYLAKMGMLSKTEKSADYHNGFMKSPDILKHLNQLLK